MNRFLADTLATINGIIAVVIVLASVLFGGATWGGDAIAFLLGALMGVAAAGFTCGTIAFLVLIESHLRTLARDREAPRQEIYRSQRSEPRVDPNL